MLDDVTVTQVSAVGELHRARPGIERRELFGSALRIGRDHISSTVNTLFLAYAGATLPLLIMFSEISEPVTSVATREVVATEIVRALVGSIGLVASVPISTWMAIAGDRHRRSRPTHSSCRRAALGGATSRSRPSVVSGCCRGDRLARSAPSFG